VPADISCLARKADKNINARKAVKRFLHIDNPQKKRSKNQARDLSWKKQQTARWKDNHRRDRMPCSSASSTTGGINLCAY
jgi:hypothetical protein